MNDTEILETERSYLPAPLCLPLFPLVTITSASTTSFSFSRAAAAASLFLFVNFRDLAGGGSMLCRCPISSSAIVFSQFMHLYRIGLEDEGLFSP